jgi:hypothetical protein
MYRLSLVGGVVLILLVISDFSEAQGNADVFDSNSSAVSNSSSRAETFNKNVSSSIAKGGFGEGGSAEATGGESSSNNALTINDTQPRQAPGVYATQQQSTTAALKCFGWGGSVAKDNHAAGTTFGWCWLQRDTWALQRSERLEREGHYTAAVAAYCSKKFHYRDYGGKAECSAARTQMYIDREIEENELIMLEQRANTAERRADELESLLNDFTNVRK